MEDQRLNDTNKIMQNTITIGQLQLWVASKLEKKKKAQSLPQ